MIRSLFGLTIVKVMRHITHETLVVQAKIKRLVSSEFFFLGDGKR